MSLAHGIDPALVTWDQSKLRAHLHECFVNKKLTMLGTVQVYIQSFILLSSLPIVLINTKVSCLNHCIICHGHQWYLSWTSLGYIIMLEIINTIISPRISYHNTKY